MRNVEPNPELGNFTSALLGNFQSALTRERTAPSIAGVRNILTTHPASGITPERLAAFLREAEQPAGAARYLELAEEMEERDLHYPACCRRASARWRRSA